jgi:hypothetical protein
VSTKEHAKDKEWLKTLREARYYSFYKNGEPAFPWWADFLICFEHGWKWIELKEDGGHITHASHDDIMSAYHDAVKQLNKVT